MTTSMYVLLIVAILITVANFTLMYRVRRNKKLAAQKYQQLMASLRDRTIKEMKRRSLHFDKTYPVVSDTDEGFLFCLDTIRQKASFADSKRVRFFDYADFLSSEVHVQISDDPKYYESVRLTVRLANSDQPLVFPLGNRRNKQSGILGKFIIDTANQLNDVINKVIARDPSVITDPNTLPTHSEPVEQQVQKEEEGPNTELDE